MKKQVVYVEPADYIPRDLRKKYKLGEFTEENVGIEMRETIETKKDTSKTDSVEAVAKLIGALDK